MSDYSSKSVLAIDTSTKDLHLALSFGGDRLVKKSQEVDRSHGQIIMKKISDLFQSAALTTGQLEGIVVTTGPGSFTGLRIGLAAAKGMAVALNIPLVGISLFELAAFKLRSRGRIMMLMPIKRDTLACTFCEGGHLSPDGVMAVALEEVADQTGGAEPAVFDHGTAAMIAAATGIPIPEVIPFEGADLIFLGRQKLTDTGGDDVADLEPLYVQKSQAEIKFDQRQQNEN